MLPLLIGMLFIIVGQGAAAFLDTVKPLRRPGPLMTAYRLLWCRGQRRKGVLTGHVFPIRPSDLTGPGGARMLTRMLRRNHLLPFGVTVTSVVDRGKKIADGVKGDKALLDVTYDGPTSLPTTFFAKFNLQSLSAMRVLVEASECVQCEATFYSKLAHEAAELGGARCYFVDYHPATGEFCLLSGHVRFGEGAVLPLLHRVRDPPDLAVLKTLVVYGAQLNARYWGGDHEANAKLPRFEETHRRMWWLAQAAGWLGLHHTARRTLKGRAGVNEALMTWRPPAELVGREAQLISDMPAILSSLCAEDKMVAYGHNDITTDNAVLRRDPAEGPNAPLVASMLDWQQARSRAPRRTDEADGRS